MKLNIILLKLTPPYSETLDLIRRPLCTKFFLIALSILKIFRCAASTIMVFTCLGFSLTSVWAVSSVVQTEQVRAELVAYAPKGVQAGQTFWLGLKLSHQPHWHTYWKNPGDSGLPTELSWVLPKNLQTKDILWPTPRKLYVSNLTNYGYEGEVLLVTPVIVSQGTQFLGSNLEIKLHANWLVCKDECVPQEGEFLLSLPIKSTSALEATSFDAVIAQQPKAISNLNQILEIRDLQLVGHILNLPLEAQARKIELFPELSEVVADPKSFDSSLNSGELIKLPIHPMRSSEPNKIPMMFVVETNQGPRSFITTFTVNGRWPSPRKFNENEAPADVAATSSASSTGIKTSPTPYLEGAKGPADLTFLIALLGALVGGMILNLMPCVLPILAIKVLSLAAHSHQVKMYRRNSMGYALGVTLCFVSLGAFAIGLKSLGVELGWGFQLQSPFALGALCVLFTLIALNLLGVFEIGVVLPNRLASMHSEDPIWEGFLSGVLSVLVAAPCTAPFMGASLGWALLAPNWQGLGVFAALGMGMSLPILAISWIPSLSRLMPRPGKWMVSLRVFLAYPMMLTVIWLLWVYGQLVDMNQMTLLAINLLTLSALIYCFALPKQSHQSNSVKVFGMIFFFIVLVITNWFWLNLEPGARLGASVDATAGSQQLSSQANQKLKWEPWTPELAQETLRLGRPVFVDFTAAWCITCQVNEHTTLENPEIQVLLLSKNVRLLRADWTKPNPTISKTLAELGRSGIPVYLLLSPNNPQLMLSEILKFQELKAALNSL